jgi:hypothetical protein
VTVAGDVPVETLPLAALGVVVDGTVEGGIALVDGGDLGAVL